MHILTTLLLSAAAVSAAPVASVNIGSIARMTEQAVIAKVRDPNCWGGKIPWPITGRVNPIKSTKASQLSLFPRPSITANKLTIHNYCDYDIDFTHLNGNDPNPLAQTLQTGTLAKNNGIWGPQPFAGTVWKARKKGDSRDLLIEYGVSKNDGLLTYNLSHVTCLGAGMDTSGCPGHDGGLNLGNQKSMTFQCEAGKWCDDQSYFYEENVCKADNPVSRCNPSLGLTMEFCASRKPKN